MSKVEYTPDQLKAIETYGENIIVSAGAGSGKTQVLSARVAHFVKEKGFKIDEFLILTFTKLAASEMKRRIRERLEEVGSSEAQYVDNADISTFDAYSLKICKKYHFLLGLNPDVSLIDSNIIAVIKNRFLEEILEEYYSSNNEVLEELLSLYCFKDDEPIIKLINEIYYAGYNEIDTESFYNNFLNNYYSNEFIDSINEKAQELSSILGDCSYDDVKNTILSTKKYGEFFIEVVIKLYNRIMEYKKSYNVYEYNDIAKLALNLLKTNEDVRGEIRDHLKMIMIDEYQDTSVIQEEFVNLIANNNLYMVGDVKQSIYRFRKAKCEIFIDKYEKYKAHNGGIAIDMNANFRSRKEVLEDINHIFSKLMTIEHGGADYRKDHIIEFGNQDFEKYKDPNNDYHLEMIKYHLDGTDKTSIEPTIIVEDIIQKVKNKYLVRDEESLRPVILSDFCILIDRGSDFDIYYKVFSEYKIPLFIEQDENIKSNMIIKVIKNLIQLVDCISSGDCGNKKFERSFVSVARSFLFSYTDQKIYDIVTKKTYFEDEIYLFLAHFLATHDDLSSSLLLKELLYELRIHEKIIRIGDVYKNERYLDTVIELFDQVTILDYSFKDFIEYLDNIDNSELKINLPSSRSDLDSVRIMNIHKSKGLEFKIVYYSGLGKKAYRTEIDKKKGFSLKYGLFLVEGKETNIIRELYKYQEACDDISEKIRLLYVSLTRCIEKMIFVVSDGEIKDKEYHNIWYLRELLNTVDFFKDFNSSIYLPQKDSLDIKGEKKKNLVVNDIQCEKIYKEVTHASKELSVDTNKKLLDLGTRLHLILEIVDLKQPSCLKLDESDKIFVDKFLASPLLKDIQNGNVYKEYQYFDDVDNERGIIDLMIEYDDHIDIIDYKTKHIDSIEYDKQLNTYRKYIKKTFKKDVKCYLYSIVDGITREVEEVK